MKYALLVYPVNQNGIFNVGDYVQSIAARQFLPSVDLYLNRERLDLPVEYPVKMILNGWFMHYPEHWPPSPEIEPLFVAFHLNKLAEEQMLSDKGVAYLKSHQPIGCRDRHTVELLRSRGVDAYLSACLTLTLGQTYNHTEEPDAPIYITDLNKTLEQNLKFKLRCLAAVVFRHRLMKKIQRRMKECGIEKSLRTATAFYATFNRVISQEVMRKAVYLEQEIPDTFSGEEEKFSYADELLRKYSRAKYVVTTRIHTALPCLAMGTPVVFVNNSLLGEVHNCRLDGLRQLFHTIEISRSGIRSEIEGVRKLTLASTFKNKPDYKEYAARLSERCKRFFQP